MLYRNDAGKEIVHNFDPSTGMHSLQHDDESESQWPTQEEAQAFLTANGFKPVPDSAEAGESDDDDDDSDEDSDKD